MKPRDNELPRVWENVFVTTEFFFYFLLLVILIELKNVVRYIVGFAINGPLYRGTTVIVFVNFHRHLKLLETE